MKTISRPLAYGLVALVVLVIAAFIVASGPLPGGGPSLYMFDDDMSGSPLAWMLVLPILLLVALLVMTLVAGAALMAVVAVAFACVLVVLALVLAIAPVVFILGLPLLAVYGIYKLVQRDRRAVAGLTPASGI